MELSDRVKSILKREGISQQEVSVMLSNLAITSVRSGFNRRYFHWLLAIDKGVLVDMQHVNMIEIGTGEDKVIEEHVDCGGKGCFECGWVGEIIRWISDHPMSVHDSTGFGVMV